MVRTFNNNHVDQYLEDSLGLEKAQLAWDPAHRLQLAEKDTRDAKEQTKNQQGQDNAKHYHGFCNKLIKKLWLDWKR